MGLLGRVSSNRLALRLLYYLWVAFPYPVRKLLTAGGILCILAMKRLAGVNRRNAPTPMRDLGSLSSWGAPSIDLDRYTVEVYGEVATPLRLTLADLVNMEAVERPVRMDCIGGFRNNSTMKGVPLLPILEAAGRNQMAESAVSRCADGYHTAQRIFDLVSGDALLTYEINGRRIERSGYPLRLVAPGTYGYKWAKWVTGIELVTGFPPGHWENEGSQGGEEWATSGEGGWPGMPLRLGFNAVEVSLDNVPVSSITTLHQLYTWRSTMSEENKALTRRFIEEVITAGNLDAVDELMAADYTEHRPFPGQESGPEGLKQMFAMMRAGFPDLDATIEDMVAEGDKVVVLLTTRGTHRGEFMGMPPTGKQVTFSEIHTIRIADGKGVDHWGEQDTMSMMQQLGAIPAP